MITVDGKLCNRIILYRSPSQIMDEFQTFDFSLNKNLCLNVVIDDFNAKSHNWYKGDKTTASESKLEIMASHYGLTQITNEATHILEICSSCRDLVFISNPDMVLDIGVHPS